ncbi:hypothetical protein EJ377_17450 [Chryseobacterium arthrosphaerae]|uniref:Fibronectin type-III domain-containing protein n=1 Tax=Chryseobacterium arthrosphaerae TaxID=651561 RepID=A0A3S0N1W2_9FLAO|nr:hypothetical protein EJ377_17450 [Chryseobacterium arthrosphaerae]
MTNLLPDTTYYWWVASNCGFTRISGAGGSFTTLPTTETGCWQSVSGVLIYNGLKQTEPMCWGDNAKGR